MIWWSKSQKVHGERWIIINVVALWKRKENKTNMRFPEFLKKNGTIGFVAPSFGCNIEPYKTSFNHALEKFHDMGYQTMLGPNCFEGSGIGISNTPEKCAAELNKMYLSDEADALISCGGGELMCEINSACSAVTFRRRFSTAGLVLAKNIFCLSLNKEDI